jgi:ABC-type uncharacterized transport system involved in gliding motility auxiliary subunit
MKKKLISLATGVNFILIIIAVNIFGGYYPFWKIDISQGKVHSLSTVTKQSLKDLDDILSIKLFITDDLPAEAKPTADNLKTIIKEFQRANRSKVKVEYLDPTKDSKAEEEAINLGIQPLQFSSIKSDKFEVSQGYLGLTIEYGGKQEVVPVAGDVNNIEYILMSSILRLDNKEEAKIAIANNNSNQEGAALLDQFLERSYVVEKVNLNEDFKIASDAASLVIVGDPNKLDDKAATKIENWINSGRGLIAFTGKVDVDQQMMPKKRAEGGLNEVFKKFGINVEPKLVADQSSAVANFRTSNGAFLSQYKYWPLVRPENVDHTMPITSGISSLLLPWSSPIKVSGNARPIVSSSQYAVLDESLTDISPKAEINTDKEGEKYCLAAVNTDKVKLAVVGNSQFVDDQFIYNNQQNLGFALNLIDYFSSNSKLLEIRSKNIVSSPLLPVNDKVKIFIRVINLALPIVLVAILAVGYTIFRKRKNQKWYEELR